MREFILLGCVVMISGCTLQRELAGGEMQRVAVVRNGHDCHADYGFRKVDFSRIDGVQAYAEIYGDSGSVYSVDMRIFNGSAREIDIDMATARIAIVARGGKRYLLQPAAGRVIDPDRLAWITTSGAPVAPADVVAILLVSPAVELALIDDANVVARNRDLCSRTPSRWWKCKLSTE